MKVIGIGQDGKLICEVDKTELKKYFECYYSNPAETKKIDDLKVGQSIDLGKGFDHLREIRDAFSETQKFVKSNEKVINAITSGLLLIANDAIKDEQS